MKKFRFLPLLLSLLLLAACGGGGTVKPMADIYAEIDQAVALPVMLELAGDDLFNYVGIAQEDYDEAVAQIPMDAISGEMLFLIAAKDDAAASRIADGLNTYFTAAKNQMRDYIPAEYAKMEKGTVTKTGRYVWLAVSAEQDKVVDIIKNNIR